MKVNGVIDRLDEIKEAHQALLAEYVATLNRVSKASFFTDIYLEVSQNFSIAYTKLKKANRKSESPYRSMYLLRAFTIKFLVRLFVESHIKNQLRTLRGAYIRLAGVIEQNDVSFAAECKWLKQAEEASLNFAGTLESWQSTRGLINALWPLAVGLFVARLKAENVYQALLTVTPIPIMTLATIFLFPVVYFCLFLSFAFMHKRLLFLPVFHEGVLERLKGKERSIRNIYEAEDKLFALLDKGKRREFPIDILAYSIGALLFGGIPIWLAITKHDHVRVSYAAGGFFIICAIVVLVVGVKRIWR